MSRLIRIVLGCLICISLQSCDPSLSLEFVNNTGKNVTIKIISQSPGVGCISFDGDKREGLDTIVIKIDPLKPSDQTYRILFGLGTWKMKHNFANLISDVKSIEIKSWDVTRIYDDSIQIKKLFEDNMEGDSRIRIKIE